MQTQIVITPWKMSFPGWHFPLFCNDIVQVTTTGRSRKHISKAHWLKILLALTPLGGINYTSFLSLVLKCSQSPYRSLQGFFESRHIANKLNSSRGNFERQVGVTVTYIRVSQCRLMRCPENYSCQTVFKPQNKQIRIMSERTTYISYEHSRSHACVCNKGESRKQSGAPRFVPAKVSCQLVTTPFFFITEKNVLFS